MFFGYFTLAVAFFLSIVAAYYSVLGLVAIFSAATIPVIIMGGALETGKVVAAMWLHRNWQRAPWTYKAYLLPSLLALMLLTSMGTFGYLSKAHSDQSLVSGDVLAKISLYDEKIKIAKDNIDAARRALKQMDEAVDQTMGRSTTESGADRAIQVRRSQARERTRLLAEIETEQRKIAELNEARAPIAAEVRKVEAEVGPIKYIAALIYGDNPESNLLESAVRWVIILIVIVFDPLAIVLILAGSRHIEWERENMARKKQTNKQINEPSIIETSTTTSTTSTTTLEPQQVTETTTTTQAPDPLIDKKPGNRRANKKTDFVPAETTEPVINMTTQTTMSWKQKLLSEYEAQPVEPDNYITMPRYEFISDDFVKINGIPKSFFKLKDEDPVNFDLILRQEDRIKEIKHILSDSVKVQFKEPTDSIKGDVYANISTLPPRVYKYNGSEWIYLSNFLEGTYIQALVDQLDNQTISIDDLNLQEQKLIKEYLANVKNNNTTG